MTMKRTAIVIAATFAGFVLLTVWLKRTPDNAPTGRAPDHPQAVQEPESGGGHTTAPGSPQDLLGSLFELAATTAREIDRVGLDLTRLNDREESELGARLSREILRHQREWNDSRSLERVQRIAAPLIEKRERRAITYRVMLLDSDEVNAFSTAGGYIYVTRGFLHQFPTDAALAMTLAHEIGHVDLRHCVEKLQYHARAKEVAGGLADVAQITYAAIRSSYTREQEFAADEYGFNAARTAGWKDQELLHFMRDLAAYGKRQNLDDSRPLSPLERRLSDYFASHPSTDERVKRLESMARR
jgi:beta-barrel assembly-enhancing protease